jgi:hypothetical protein
MIEINEISESLKTILGHKEVRITAYSENFSRSRIMITFIDRGELFQTTITSDWQKTLKSNIK